MTQTLLGFLSRKALCHSRWEKYICIWKSMEWHVHCWKFGQLLNAFQASSMPPAVLWMTTWVLFPVTRLCAHLHTQSKKQKPKCCFHTNFTIEHAAKKDCSNCSFSKLCNQHLAFQLLSAIQSFATNILLFSCYQLFKALQPTSCFSVVVSYSKLCNQHLALRKRNFRKSAIVWLWIFTAKTILTHTRMSFCMYQKHIELTNLTSYN